MRERRGRGGEAGFTGAASRRRRDESGAGSRRRARGGTAGDAAADGTRGGQGRRGAAAAASCDDGLRHGGRGGEVSGRAGRGGKGRRRGQARDAGAPGETMAARRALRRPQSVSRSTPRRLQRNRRTSLLRLGASRSARGRQGFPFSSRIVSQGTLVAKAACGIAGLSCRCGWRFHMCAGLQRAPPG